MIRPFRPIVRPSYSSEQPPYSSEQPSFQPPPPPSYDTALAESFQGPSGVVGAPAGSIAPSLLISPSLLPDYFDVSIIPVGSILIKIEVTRLMSTYWSRIVCVPNKETGPRTLRETLEDYTRSENIWKEIHLTKQPLWDFNELSRALEFAVRQAGYNEKVKISLSSTSRKVSVFITFITIITIIGYMLEF
ncbi:hypothetical protein BSLG_004283 [Batrachochytrium salamandrivorans]|nr:hypothetical protein BSLG_004283 [Batrachochytrium salamandrivorans]